MLEQVSEEDLELIHAMALYWSQVYRNQGLEMERMDEWIKERLLFPKEVADLSQSFKKDGQYADAIGLLVWHFTARALLYPDLEDTGSRIWKILGRAPKSSFELANELIEKTNKAALRPSDKLELLEL